MFITELIKTALEIVKCISVLYANTMAVLQRLLRIS